MRLLSMKAAIILPMLLCSFVALPAWATPGLAQLEGRVLDERSHLPLPPGLTWVLAYAKDLAEPADKAPVDEKGNYILLVDPGQYSVRVLVDGKAIREESVTVAQGPLNKDFLVAAPARTTKKERRRHALHHALPRPAPPLASEHL
jgi:hypothetical protein